MTSGFPGLGPYLVLIKMGGLSKKNQVFTDPQMNITWELGQVSSVYFFGAREQE